MSRKKSTIVRIQMTAIRLGFRALDRVAPSVGERWAERLWCTPRHARQQDSMVDPGEISTVDYNGRAVAVEAWGAGPVVYLVHGWGGWRGQLTGFVAPLVDAGYRVVTFDSPGHGQSEPGEFGPGRALLIEFSGALNAVIKDNGQPYAVIAHSGGCMAVGVAIADGLSVERLVLISPMGEVGFYAHQFAHTLAISDRIRQGFLRRLENRVGYLMSDFDLVTLPDRAMEVPSTLVIHDRRDSNTRHSDSVAIVESWPESQLMSTEGLGHRRILRDSQVIAEVTGFVA